MRIFRSILAGLLFALPLTSGWAAPVGAYGETVLVTSATDPDLINPWGISFSATSPFWVSDNGTGKSTLYNGAGVKLGLVVSMPSGSEAVTGQVFGGGASGFRGESFVFSTENGTITGWHTGTIAETLFTVANAVYKGLAISNDRSTLYAPNFAAGTVDVFGSAGLTGSFVDPTIPSGYAPFNVQNIGGKLYVTFALRNGIDDVPGAGHGFVKVFDPISHTFFGLIAQGVLDSPWGLALAPAGFGAFGGDLLVGNFGDGLINAFDPLTGALLGTVADLNHHPLVNDGLWGLSFGNGGNGGSPNSLYLTAGPNDESGGIFARIDAVPEPGTAWLLVLPVLMLGAGGFRRRMRAPR